MIGTSCCADSDRKVHVIKEGLDKKMGGHSYFLMNKISQSVFTEGAESVCILLIQILDSSWSE